MIKAVIFDMDGVLIDLEPIFETHKREYLRKMGYEIPDGFFDQYRGSTRKGYWEALIGILRIPVPIDKLIVESRKDYLKFLKTADLQANSGTEQLIEGLLKKGLKLAVASSASRERIRTLLKRIRLEDKFQIVVCGDDVTHGKPAPDIYLKVIEMLKIRPEECLAIEDTTNGVKSAKAAGMKVIGYAGAPHNKQDLSDTDLIIKDFPKLNWGIISKI